MSILFAFGALTFMQVKLNSLPASLERARLCAAHCTAHACTQCHLQLIVTRFNSDAQQCTDTPNTAANRTYSFAAC